MAIFAKHSLQLFLLVKAMMFSPIKKNPKVCPIFFDNSSAQKQRFSLPYLLMCTITPNWSSPVYQKLIQTCKFFFGKHRIVVIDNLDVTKVILTGADDLAESSGWT